MISFIGNNLNIGIIAGNDNNDAWMSYVLWYSIHRFLPDATMFILSKKRPDNPQALLWTHKAGIRRQFSLSEENYPLLLLSPGVIALKELDESITDTLNEINCGVFPGGWFYGRKASTDLVAIDISVKTPSDDLKPFAFYDGKCGLFNLKEWKKEIPPFDEAHKLYSDNISLVEKRILDMWGSMSSAYNAMNITDNYRLGNYL